MNKPPVAVTDAELKELASCKNLREMWGASSDDDFEEELRELWIAKFSDYITDGPGYSGEVFVILSGVLDAVLVIRGEGRTLEVWEQQY